MSTVAFARLVREELADDLSSAEAAMLSGGIKSFEEYQHIAGKRQGLLQAIAVVDDVTRRFDEAN